MLNIVVDVFVKHYNNESYWILLLREIYVKILTPINSLIQLLKVDTTSPCYANYRLACFSYIQTRVEPKYRANGLLHDDNL